MKSTCYTLILLLVCIFFGCGSDKIEYKISDTELKINATAHSQTISKDSLILESIKVIDLNSSQNYSPHIRIWGIGLSGIHIEKLNLDEYLEGWFLLNNDEIALVFLENQKKALYIETKMKPPAHVRLISKIDIDNPSEKKYFLLLGTDNPLELKKMIINKWNQK